MATSVLRPAPTAITIALIAAATILGAYFFEYVIKLAPCPLCLEQRIPYYVGIPLALIVALAASKRAPPLAIEFGFFALALVFLFSAGLGMYHAGIEWKFWQGPVECTGPLRPFGTGGDLLSQIQNTSVVRCDEAAWRLFGLSLAGYNVLISFALAFLAFSAARPASVSRHTQP
ncbi:MAG: disulfide bond formation protein B [Xanthobacteraceae bacterium]